MKLPEFRKQATAGGVEAGQSETTAVPAVPKKKAVAAIREFSLERRLAFTIDDDAIQMAAARHLGFHVRLLDATKYYFPKEQDRSENRRHLLLNTISEYVDRYGGRHPTVSLTLTGPQTALRSIILPNLKRAELRAALSYEGRRQVPFPAEDCWLDYRILETISQGRERRVRASALAATKLAVQDLTAPFEDLNLDVGHIYHTQDVIGQLLELLPDYREDAYYTLIDVHSRSTEIAYFRGRNLEFYHVSSLGSSFLANRSDPTVFEYFAESLATEIQNSLDYYGGQFSGNREPEILVYGDLAYTEELIDLISDRYGLKFRRFPAKDLDLAGKISPDDICVNLPAVAAAVSRVRLANLLPTPIRQKLQIRKGNQIGATALAVLAFFLVAHWSVITTSLSTAEDQLIVKQQQADEFQASEMFATYNRLKRKLTANQAFIAKTREEPSYLGLNMKELSHQVPGPVHLYDLEFNAGAPDRNYLLSGLITGGTAPPELILAEMVENLLASPFFEDVVVERHVKRRKPEGSVLDFTLSMRAVT